MVKKGRSLTMGVESALQVSRCDGHATFLETVSGSAEGGQNLVVLLQDRDWRSPASGVIVWTANGKKKAEASASADAAHDYTLTRVMLMAASGYTQWGFGQAAGLPLLQLQSSAATMVLSGDGHRREN